MLPVRDRLPFWCEVFARKIVRVDIEPDSDSPFEAEATLRELPGLRILWNSVATPAHQLRTPRTIAAGEDSFAFIINLGRPLPIWQLGRELQLGAGDAVAVLHTEPAGMKQSRCDYVGLVLPCSPMAPLVVSLDEGAMRLIPRDTEALSLLRAYLQLIRAGLPVSTPELGHLVATHVHDLVALVLGARRDGASLAKRRGLRAARLQAVKADILDHLESEDATVEAVAARQKVTPRYIQMLFEGEGRTFSQFVLDERLARAHRMLTDRRCAGRTIGSVAYAAGFGDLSYFNRTFRRRFGATPSDVRAVATDGRLH
jgi:AraC-like DNA-binding protein